MRETKATGTAGDPPAPDDGLASQSRGYLPHREGSGLLQMITFSLAGALPRHVRDATAGSSWDAGLDAGYGECFLSDPRIARVVEEQLLHFDGERYRLLAWVAMPNHVHVLIETFATHSLSAILHSWKSYSAKAANRLLARQGAFWYPEYFDRAIRDERHLSAAIEYIHNNPIKAGLVDQAGEWLFSSARSTSQTWGAGEVARGPGRAPR